MGHKPTREHGLVTPCPTDRYCLFLLQKNFEIGYYYYYYYYYYKSMLLECHTVKKTSRALNSKKKIKSNSVTQFSQR